jgi:hypothetical protein
MSRVTTFLYGALLVLAALDAMIFGFVPPVALPLIVVILGVLVFFTPILRTGLGATGIGSPFNLIRRWVFGAVLVILGLASSDLLGSFLDFGGFNIFGYLTLDDFMGQLVLLLIGVIYFLAAFARTRQINVSSF